MVRNQTFLFYFCLNMQVSGLREDILIWRYLAVPACWVSQTHPHSPWDLRIQTAGWREPLCEMRLYQLSLPKHWDIQLHQYLVNRWVQIRQIQYAFQSNRSKCLVYLQGKNNLDIPNLALVSVKCWASLICDRASVLINSLVSLCSVGSSGLAL